MPGRWHRPRWPSSNGHSALPATVVCLSGILDIGLALDTNDNCYVTGWFDGTNNFGGVTLTNQSTGGGSDIFVAKYNASGTLQWVQQAGQSAGNVNYGRAVGADTNGNIYVTGGYQGPATFGNTSICRPLRVSNFSLPNTTPLPVRFNGFKPPLAESSSITASD